MSDVPAPVFVDSTVAATYRFGLYAASGEGKTVAACSAPKPLLVINADRPSAYVFAAKFHGLTRGATGTLREMRYEDEATLSSAYAYLRSDEGNDVRTVILDPVGNIYDALRLSGKFIRAEDGDIDYDAVNAKVVGFVRELRKLDVNVVLIGHEKVNDSGKRKDGKTYPAFGGMTLINKLLGEMDVVAHVERYQRRDPETGELGEVQWIGQIAPVDNLVGKGYGLALGDRRILDLARWIQVIDEDFKPDDSDLPWTELTDASPPQDSDDDAHDAGPVPAAPGEPRGSDDPDAPAEPSSPDGESHAGTTGATESAPAVSGSSGSSPDDAEPGVSSFLPGKRHEERAGSGEGVEHPPTPEPLPEGEAPIDEALAISQRLATAPDTLSSLDVIALLGEEDFELLDKLAAGKTARTIAEEALPEGTEEEPDVAPVRAHVQQIKKLLGQSSIAPIVLLWKRMQTEEQAGA